MSIKKKLDTFSMLQEKMCSDFLQQAADQHPHKVRKLIYLEGDFTAVYTKLRQQQTNTLIRGI